MRHTSATLHIAFVSALVMAALCVACAQTNKSYDSRLATITSYSIQTPEVTPGGVHYGGPLDPLVLDALVERTRRCLAVIPEPSPTAKEQMDCPVRPLRREVDVSLFNVMVPWDWRPSDFNDGKQVFPCDVDPQLCRDKGLEPTVDKVCSCRATVQYGRTIITAPNMEMLPAELVRLVTACNYTWEYPLAACSAP